MKISVNLLLLLSLFMVSCAEKSEIKPLFKAKSFYEATNGKPIKLIIPLTNKTMDRIDSVVSTSGKELSKAGFFERAWEEIKGTVYNIAVRFGMGKLKISLEHSLMETNQFGEETGLTPEIIQDYVKSVKISKVFFTIKRPCEVRPDDKECQDWTGLVKKNDKIKNASFDMINKVFVNMSLKDRKEKISEEVTISDEIEKIYKIKNEQLQSSQLNLNNQDLVSKVSLPQDFNLGYFFSENPNLSKPYILKSSTHRNQLIYEVQSSRSQELGKRLISYLALENGVSEQMMQTLLKNELLISEQTVLIDLNNFKYLTKDVKSFFAREELSVESCNSYRCVKPTLTDRKLRREYKYTLKNVNDDKRNIFIVINDKPKKFKGFFLEDLAAKLKVDADLIKSSLNDQVVNLKNATIIDLNRFPEEVNYFINFYKSHGRNIAYCAKEQCLPLSTDKVFDNIDHLKLPQDKLSSIYLLNVKEEEKVEIKNKILNFVAKEHKIDARRLENEMLGDIIPMHDQIVFNLGKFTKYESSFKQAFALNNIKSKTCNAKRCLFLGSNKMELKPLLSKSTAGAIDIYLDVRKVPEVALYLKGYLELEIVLDI